jgi:hypothetical protein
MSMCVFSLSSSISLIIFNAGLSDKTSAPVRQKTSTPTNNATPFHSLHSTSETIKQHCSKRHGEAGEGSGLMNNRENPMFNNSETWGYRKIGH